MKNILYITPVLSHPASGGPALRVENSIKALNQISKLHVIARVSRAEVGGNNAEMFFRQISYKFEYAPSVALNNRLPMVKFKVKVISSLINFCVRAIRKVVRSSFRFDDVRYICEYIDTHHIDVVWISFGNISYELMVKLKESFPEIKMVCDTDSVWSKFLLRELPYENNVERKKEIRDAGSQKEIEERHWVEFMDVTTAVSEIDADYYRQYTKKDKIKIFPNVIDTTNYAKQPMPKDFQNPCIYIAGSFFSDTCPMMKGTAWFLENVFPLLKEQIPGIHLYIIGSGSDKRLSRIKDNQITITGMVDSVLPYLTNVDICLVPLFFESGTRFKILEAGAAGVPIVSTTLGAEGIPVIHGKHILLADDPASFVQCIIEVIYDKPFANKLAANCRKMVQENYDIESLSKAGREIMEYLELEIDRAY